MTLGRGTATIEIHIFRRLVLKVSAVFNFHIEPSVAPLALSVDGNAVADGATVAESGKVGTPFSSVVKITGGRPPYDVKPTGTGPDGISGVFDGVDTVTFSGTPTTAGDATVTLEVTDADGVPVQ